MSESRSPLIDEAITEGTRQVYLAYADQRPLDTASILRPARAELVRLLLARLMRGNP
jgi:hypothetical protein